MAFFELGEPIKVEDNGKRITINDLPDAIYDKNQDSLYFKKLTTISSIFKGIDVLYREATNEETEEFLSVDFICLGSGFNAEKVKTNNRKRMTKCSEVLNRLSKKQIRQLLDYAHTYFPSLKYEESKRVFTVKSDEDLKHLLLGIEQRYYTTDVTGEKKIGKFSSIIRQL